ncbi:MAG: insulinase family protein [Clostridia bacterium]|nr:insulinase family protein [Clostridia bacterium]
MEYKKINIKKGINLHYINTDKFKTNLIAVFLTTTIKREDVTKNALISAVLRRGSKNMKTQEEISKALENMYGASFDCGIDRTGKNQVLKFYIESINDNFLPNNKENLLKQSLERIFEIVFNPLIEENGFNKAYVNQEKDNIKNIIKSRIDNKARYAMDRCIETMYGKDGYGIFKYGYIEDLEKIDNINLYEQYQKLLNECKIDIFVSGKINEETLKIIKENENIKKLNERESKYTPTNLEKREIPKQEKNQTDSMQVSQGKLTIGLDIDIKNEDEKFDVLIYNTILGGSANSKMFQNVREKEHLAYVASSSYLRHMNNIFINCGIEIENFEKTVDIVRKQIEDMKNEEFSEEDIQNAKKVIISGIKSIDDEQDSGITYKFGQELSNMEISLEDYINRINKITKEDIIKIAKSVYINTIYFLKD